MATYYRLPAPTSGIRSQGLTSWDGGAVLFGAWYENSAFLLASGATSGTPVTATTISGDVNFGFAAVAPDGFNGGVLTEFGPKVWYYPSNAIVESYAVAATGILNGTAIASDGNSYVTDVLGNVYTVTVSGLDILVQTDVLSLSNIFATGLGGFAYYGTFGRDIRGLATSGLSLFSVAASGAEVATFYVSGAVSGVITAPIDNLNSIIATTNKIAVGGWSGAAIASGFNAMQTDPVNGDVFAACVSGNAAVYLWSNDTSGNWSLNQTQAVSGSPQFLGWTPIGNTILATDPVSGYVNVLGYSLGSLTLAQVIALADAGAVAATADSQKAIVCRTSTNDVVPLAVSGATWVSGTAVPIGTPESVIAYNSTQMLVGCSSGIAYLTYNAGAWSVTSTTALSFVPTALALDEASGIIAAGTAGSSGFVYANGTTLGFSGAVSGMFYQQGQIVVGDPTIPALRVFNSTGTLAQQASAAIAASPLALNTTLYEVFAASSGRTEQFVFTAPYTLSPEQSGAVGVYSGATWVTTPLDVSHVPEGLAFDVSGNVSVVTLQNELFTVSTTGGIISSGVIAQFTGQSQNVPFGFSSIQWINGKLYGTSTLNEALAEIA